MLKQLRLLIRQAERSLRLWRAWSGILRLLVPLPDDAHHDHDEEQQDGDGEADDQDENGQRLVGGRVGATRRWHDLVGEDVSFCKGKNYVVK